MLQALLLQFAKFPGAETIHLLQGAVAGWLLASGYLANRTARIVLALALMKGFAIYEGYERWVIGDRADIDFQVFLIMMWLTASVTLVIGLWQQRNKPDPD